jgi:hypothetical protein
VSDDDATGDATGDTQVQRLRAVERTVERILSVPARESRMIVRWGDAFAVVSGSPDAAQVGLLVPSSHHLPEGLSLSTERAHTLRTRGFEKHGARRPFTKEVARRRVEPSKLAEELLTLLAEVYDAARSERFDVSLIHDDREHPENPRFVDVMTTMSRGFDWEVRKRLYDEFVNAMLLVPTTTDEDGDDVPAVLEHEDGHPVYVAFSDWPSLRAHAPLMDHYLPVQGADLAEYVHAHTPGGLRINPAGDVGGRLLGHELESLVEALAAWRRSQAN